MFLQNILADAQHAMFKMGSNLKKGLIQIYTGNGKGKTTAAFGLALRASGHGFKVLILQFLKCGAFTGEFNALKSFSNVKIVQFGKECCSLREVKSDFEIEQCQECFLVTKQDKSVAEKGLTLAKEALISGEYDLVILDELIMAIDVKLIDLSDVISLISMKDQTTELILTGRNAPNELINMADYVSEIKDVKHPFEKNIDARRGIEY